MKKLTLYAFLLLVLTFSVYAGSVNITASTDNKYLYKTSDYNTNHSISWDEAHDSATATSVVSSSNLFTQVSRDNSSGNYRYRIYRTPLSFNTSSIPDSAVITSASIHVRVDDNNSAENDGKDYILFVESTQASTIPVAGDYDGCGDTAYSDKRDLSSNITKDTFNEFPLNIDGKNYIDKTGYTHFCMREGHDFEDEPFDTVATNLLKIIAAADFDPLFYSPYIYIEYVSAPELTTPTLSPETAYTYSNITASTTYSHDDSITSNITAYWYVDGSNVINETFNDVSVGTTINSTLGSGNYTQEQIINVSFIAIDGNGYNSTKSSTKTIINHIPSITSASITPDPADILDNLTCVNGSISDADGDSLTIYYSWYNNSVKLDYTTNTLHSGNFSAGDEIYCMINITDGYNYSSATSQTVIIDSLQTAPTLNWTNATTATTLITSDSTNPTNNNSWVNLSVTFNDANSGELHTAYFCKTNSFSGECDGDTFCVSAINSSATPELSCRYNLSSETSMNISYYVYVIDNTSLHQGSGSGLSGSFVVNYPPSIPAILTIKNNSWVTQNSTILEFNSTDPDGDTVTYLIYGDENGTDYSLINATQSTFNWTNLNETYYYFKVRANDSHGYLTYTNTSVVKFGVDYTAPTLTNDTYNGDIYTDEVETITIECSDWFSGVNTSKVYYNITTPILTTTEEYMSSYRNDTYIDSYAPLGSVGTYYVDKFTCYDLAGNSVTYSSNINFTTSTRPVVGSSGGGGGDIIIQSLYNASDLAFCGDGICSGEENPGNCLADCKINFDSLVTCWFNDPKTCMYSESWFVNILLFIIVVAIIILITAQNKNIYKLKKKIIK